MTVPVGFPLLLPPKVADPSNVLSSGGLTAAAHDLGALDAPVLARVTRSIDQNIPSGGARTTNILFFDGIDTDDYGMWNAGRPERLTIPVDGWYVPSLTFSFAASAPAAFDEEVGIVANRINGALVFLLAESRPSPTDVTLGRFFSVTGPARLLGVGDYVWAYAWQNSGSPLNSLVNQLPISFELRRIGGRPINPNTIDALTGAQADALSGTALDALQGG